MSRIDITTGERTVLAEGISPAYTLLDVYPAFTPSSVAVAPSGNIYVTSPTDGNVWRILAP